VAGVSASQKILDAQELMRRLLAGYTLKECAAILCVTYHTVCKKARQPEFLVELKSLNHEMYSQVDGELKAINGLMTERLVELSSVALDKLEVLLHAESTDDRLVVRIAQDFLDRTGETNKRTQTTVKTEHSFMNPRVLVDAAKAAAEMEDELSAR
jgi:hypothetical protein